MSTEAAQRWSSRKFWTMNFWMLVFTGLLAADFLSPEIYSMLAGGTLGVYLCANVAEHVWGRK